MIPLDFLLANVDPANLGALFVIYRRLAQRIERLERSDASIEPAD